MCLFRACATVLQQELFKKLEKFTERSRGFLNAAQTIAMRETHQRLSPEHLLKALMDDDQFRMLDANELSDDLIAGHFGVPVEQVEAKRRDFA